MRQSAIKGDAPEQLDDDDASPPRPPSLLHPGREEYDKEKTRRRGPELISGEDGEGPPVPVHYSSNVEDEAGGEKRKSGVAGRPAASYKARIINEAKPRISSGGTPRPSTTEALPGEADTQSPLMGNEPTPGTAADAASPFVTFYAVEATLVPDDPPPPQYASYQRQSLPGESSAGEPVYDAVRVPDHTDEESWWREEWRRNRTLIVLGVPYVWLALQVGRLGGFLWGELLELVSFLLGR